MSEEDCNSIKDTMRQYKDLEYKPHIEEEILLEFHNPAQKSVSLK